jgi:hypothetical protein
MDPYLEHPSLWPDVHNSLVAAIRDDLAERLAPRYYVGTERPHARLFAFNLRQPIPSFNIPLLPGDEEPLLDLGRVLHELYDRARFDLRLNYGKAAVPPLREDDAAWIAELL